MCSSRPFEVRTFANCNSLPSEKSSPTVSHSDNIFLTMFSLVSNSLMTWMLLSDGVLIDFRTLLLQESVLKITVTTQRCIENVPLYSF